MRSVFPWGDGSKGHYFVVGEVFFDGFKSTAERDAAALEIQGKLEQALGRKITGDEALYGVHRDARPSYAIREKWEKVFAPPEQPREPNKFKRMMAERREKREREKDPEMYHLRQLAEEEDRRLAVVEKEKLIAANPTCQRAIQRAKELAAAFQLDKRATADQVFESTQLLRLAQKGDAGAFEVAHNDFVNNYGQYLREKNAEALAAARAAEESAKRASQNFNL